MLISGSDVINIMKLLNINVNGALHIGAHECEELPFYNQMGISSHNVVWIEAMPNKVNEAKNRGIPNMYHAVITDKDDENTIFHITNNGQSSSVLDFGSHAQHHPSVHFIENIELKTITIDTFFKRNGLNPANYDFWNFDIQGAELMALMGAKGALQFPKAIYLEVNTEEVYKGCGTRDQIDALLKTYGFVRIKTEMTPHGWGDALYIRN